MMQMAEPKVVDAIDKAEEIAHLCRIMTTRIPRLPIAIVSTGLPDIMLPVESLAELQAMHPDMEALAAFSREKKVVGVHAFVLSQNAGDGSTAHVRNFAPLYGVDEESATGTANAALRHYLHMNGIVEETAECNFVQGEVMQRPSVVTARRDVDGRIYVGGCCRIVAKGKLMV